MSDTRIQPWKAHWPPQTAMKEDRTLGASAGARLEIDGTSGSGFGWIPENKDAPAKPKEPEVKEQEHKDVEYKETDTKETDEKEPEVKQPEVKQPAIEGAQKAAPHTNTPLQMDSQLKERLASGPVPSIHVNVQHPKPSPRL